MKNFVQPGKTIDVTASADIASGAPVVIGATVGVAAGAIANGATGVVNLEGVYSLPKGAGAITQGAKIYIPTAGGDVTTTATSNVFVGYAHAAAANDATTVDVLLAR